MTDYGATPPSGGADSELQDFLMAEKQKAQVNAQVSISTPFNVDFVNVHCQYSLTD